MKFQLTEDYIYKLNNDGSITAYPLSLLSDEEKRQIYEQCEYQSYERI
jgi:hypothetical protein